MEVDTLEVKQVLKRSLLTGFLGGIFWCMITLVLHYFNIIDVSPYDYLKWFKLSEKWLKTFAGVVFTILIYGIISIGIAYLYYLFFKKIEGLLIGIVYGLMLFVFVLIIIPQINSHVPNILLMSYRSITTSICLFILYGLFIGYSISFDYKQMKVQLKMKHR